MIVRLKAIKRALRARDIASSALLGMRRETLIKWINTQEDEHERELIWELARTLDLKARIREWRSPLRAGTTFLPVSRGCIHCFCVKKKLKLKTMDDFIGRNQKQEHLYCCTEHKPDLSAALLRLDQ